MGKGIVIGLVDYVLVSPTGCSSLRENAFLRESQQVLLNGKKLTVTSKLNAGYPWHDPRFDPKLL